MIQDILLNALKDVVGMLLSPKILVGLYAEAEVLALAWQIVLDMDQHADRMETAVVGIVALNKSYL